jgi:hypothetical protein
LSVVVAATILLGAHNLIHAAARGLGADPPPARVAVWLSLGILVVVALPLGVKVRQIRDL